LDIKDNSLEKRQLEVNLCDRGGGGWSVEEREWNEGKRNHLTPHLHGTTWVVDYWACRADRKRCPFATLM
jgi:hypothetical protein